MEIDNKDNILCSRVELVEWVNEILHTSFNNLNEIAASTLALLLYGVFCHSSSFIHRQLLSTLQQINFTKGNAPRTTESKYTSLVLQLVNNLFVEIDVTSDTQTVSASFTVNNNNINNKIEAKRVISASYEETEREHTVQQDKRSLIDLNVLNVNDWIDGRAFVEELCVWRWLRQAAQTLRLTPCQIEKNITEYVNGNVDMIHRETNDDNDNDNDNDNDKENIAPGNKKARTEESDDKYNVSTHLSEYLHTRNKLNDYIALTSNNNKCTNTTSEQITGSNVCGNPVITQNVSANVPHLLQASHASAINFAEAIIKVSSKNKEEKQNEEQKTEIVEEEMEANGVTNMSIINGNNKEEDDDNSHSSLHVTDLADAMNIISSFSKTQSRSNTHNGVDVAESENSETNNNNDNMTKRKGGNGGYLCTECPLVFAHALECNLNLIAEMEKTRKEAIAACKKRDALALLRAFSKLA